MAPRDLQLRHLRNLDGLRGYAVLIVLVSHISNQNFVKYRFFGEGFGQIGVMIFFALSGFLMAYLYADRPFNGRELLNFATRRSARVLPLYFAVVFLSLILTQYLPHAFQLFKIGFGDLWQYLVFWDADFVLWTIPVEVQFYCLFPLFWYLRARHGIGSMIAACILLLLLHAYLTYSANGTLLNMMPVLIPRLHFFIVGLLVCAAYCNLGTITGNWVNALFAMSLTLSVLMAPNVFKTMLGQSRDMWGTGQMLLVVAALLYSSLYSGLAKVLFGNQIAAFYGRISYSLYMLHVPCISAIRLYTHAHENLLLFASGTLLLSTIVAYCSYRFFELPARQWLTGGGSH